MMAEVVAPEPLAQDDEECELIVMDANGDRRFRWRKRKEKTTTATIPVDIMPPPAEEHEDVKEARRIFDQHIARGGKAWALTRKNGGGRLLEQSEAARHFDPGTTYLLGAAPESGKS